MNSSVRKAINEISESIQEALNIEIPITNIEQIVQSINGEVITVDYLPENAEGRIYRKEDKFVIEIPSMDNNNRINFTIAHELGHLFLHMGYLIDNEIWEKNLNNEFFRKEIGEMEYQAHEFAAAFLMPREIFYNVMNENYHGNGYYDIEAVARYFNVSVSAAENRAKWLGLLKWV